MSDLELSVGQSAADKLVDAASYPLNLFEHRSPFQGLNALMSGIDQFALTADQVRLLLERAEKVASSNQAPPKKSPSPFADSDVDLAILRSTEALQAEAKALLDNPPTAPNADAKRALEELYATGRVSSLASIKGIEFRGHVPWVKVDLASRPIVALASPVAAARDVNLVVGITCELWWYHPVPKWDWPWKWPWQWDRILSVTLSVPIGVSGEVHLSGEGPRLVARAVCTSLRLKLPILEWFELAPIANSYLKDKGLVAIDTSNILPTVPIINARFQVAGVTFPNTTSSIGVLVDVSR